MAPPRKTNRREFLRGEAAAHALADAAQSALAPSAESPPTPAPAPETYLVRLARRAMACEFEIYLNAGQYARGAETAHAAFDLIDELEQQLSIYRGDSEISRINREAARAPLEVEPRLFALLSQAVALGRDTEGAFDITTGPLSRLWGFTQRSGALADEKAIRDQLAHVGADKLNLEPPAHISFLSPGVEINLGSIGKGYALDRAAELFAAAGIDDVLLHGGNSSVLARGAQGNGPREFGWTVGLRNPWKPQQRLAEIRLRDRALATSGSGSQFFEHAGRRLGHLLDPRTGWPAEGVLSATALATSGAIADGLSTAFYVLGAERTAAWCALHPDVGAVLVCPGAVAGRVQIHVCGLDAQEFVLFDT